MSGKGNLGVFGVTFFVILSVGLFVMFAGFDTVDANHLGVKVRLGKMAGIMEPGMQWTGVLTTVHQYDMRIRQVRVDMQGADAAADRDGQTVYGSVSVNYRLKGDKNVVEKLYVNVGGDDVIAQRLNIEPIIREGFKQATVQFEAIQILEKRQEVKELAKENIKRNFPAEYFEIVDIVVENIDFSDGFNQAIEAKKVATQNRLKEEEQVQVVKFQQQQEIEKYKAEAEKLRLQKAEVTALLNEQKMIEKWDGKLPGYLIITPDSQGLFLQLAQGQGLAQQVSQ